MKKTYMIPEMEVVNIHSVQLLAGSSLHSAGGGQSTDIPEAPEFDLFDY